MKTKKGPWGISSTPLTQETEYFLVSLRRNKRLSLTELRELLDWIASEASDMQGCKDPDAIEDLRELIIADRAGRCRYCHFPTSRRDEHGRLACSEACTGALQARAEGYGEARVRSAWERCPPEMRRPAALPSREHTEQEAPHGARVDAA